MSGENENTRGVECGHSRWERGHFLKPTCQQWSRAISCHNGDKPGSPKNAEACSGGADNEKCFLFLIPWTMSLLAPGKRDETARKGRFLFFSLTDIYNNQSASPLDHTPPTAHRQTHECEQRRHGAAERGGRGRPRPCSTLRFPTVTAKNMGNMYHVCFCSAPEFLKC